MICTRIGSTQCEFCVGLNTKPTSLRKTLFRSAEELRECRIKSIEGLRECSIGAGGLEPVALLPVRPRRRSHEELRECEEREGSGTRTMDPGRALTALAEVEGTGSSTTAAAAGTASLEGIGGAARKP